MRNIHEDICGLHQSVPKMKKLFKRADLYELAMMSDSFKQYKGCEECQRFAHCVDTSYYQIMVVPRLRIWISLIKLILHLQRGIASC